MNVAWVVYELVWAVMGVAAAALLVCIAVEIVRVEKIYRRIRGPRR